MAGNVDDNDWDHAGLERTVDVIYGNNNNLSFSDRLQIVSLDDQRTKARTLLESWGTNLQLNDEDPFGNGDQSVIRMAAERKEARVLFSDGGDLRAAIFARSFSKFSLACLDGDMGLLVRQMMGNVSQTLKQPYSRQNKWKELLDARETAMRHSPLSLLCSVGKFWIGTGQPKHPTTAKLLLRAGASPNCCDVLGKTVVHHGAGMKASTESMNGKKGISGRFDVESGRVFVYIPKGRKEIWVKPENIQIDSDATCKLLSDVQDRQGSVSLHEVVTREREDCAKLLLEKHDTSIHTEDMDGCSPLKSVVNLGAAMYGKVGKIISNVTRMEAKVIKDAKKTARDVCANCNKPLGKDKGMKCAKCLVASYCDRDCQIKHWKEGGHKQECKILAAQKEGIQLSWDHLQYNNDPRLTAMTYGPLYKDSVRIPDGVKPGEKFVIKIQANDQHMPLMIYDETRTCQFCYVASGPGHKEMWEAAKKEPAWGGRKTFMKASWKVAAFRAPCLRQSVYRHCLYH